MPKPWESEEWQMRKRMRWGSNRHIKELLYRSKKKRRVRKENREGQRSRHKKSYERRR
jgi:hypothetical protein